MQHTSADRPQKTQSKKDGSYKNGVIKRVNSRQNEKLNIVNEELLDVQRIMEKLFYWAAIIESSDDAIFGKTLEGVITSWNYGAERMYGYQADEIIGKPVTLLFPQDRKDEYRYIMNHVTRGEAIDHFETRRTRKDGTEITVSVTISPIKDFKGAIIGVSSIARDITERKHTENNFRFLADASTILSSSLDYKTTLKNVAKIAVPEIADWCRVDMLNATGDLENVAVVHRDPKKMKLAIDLRKKFPFDTMDNQGTGRVMRTGKSAFFPHVTNVFLDHAIQNQEQMKLIKSIGVSSVILVPICIEKKCIGTIAFINSRPGKIFTKNDLLMAEELGKRAALAIENSRLYEAAQKAIVLRDDFISVASHELKTPVTSLKMYVQVLQRQCDKKGKNNLTQFTEKIGDQIDKLTVLINDLLSVSRVQHGRLEFNFEDFDLNELVRESIEHMRPTSPRHKFIVQGSVKKEIHGDRYRLYQVVTNLLSNAVKYSPKADKVIISLRDGEKSAKIEVKDFGIGISPENKHKIFEQFYRAEEVDDRTFPGLGLGLYISNEIVKRHGGSLDVQSKKGKGSEFSFTIPFASSKNKKNPA